MGGGGGRKEKMEDWGGGIQSFGAVFILFQHSRRAGLLASLILLKARSDYAKPIATQIFKAKSHSSKVSRLLALKCCYISFSARFWFHWESSFQNCKYTPPPRHFVIFKVKTQATSDI